MDYTATLILAYSDTLKRWFIRDNDNNVIGYLRMSRSDAIESGKTRLSIRMYGRTRFGILVDGESPEHHKVSIQTMFFAAGVEPVYIDSSGLEGDDYFHKVIGFNALPAHHPASVIHLAKAREFDDGEF